LDASDVLRFDSAALIRRSRQALAASNVAIVATQQIIVRSTRRILQHVRGGSTDHPGTDELRARLAALPQGTPSVYAGPGMNGKCDLCGKDILLGATEFEVVFSAVSIRFDRKCFMLWQSQAPKQ
jgi:hypothetical protein